MVGYSGTPGTINVNRTGRYVRVQLAGTGYLVLGEVKVLSATSGAGGGGANMQWLVADQLGTPRMVFDQTGSLATMKRHDYLPFGEELTANQGLRNTTPSYGADNVRQKFTKYERDNETWLDYAKARYYANTSGRFISVDSIQGSTRNPQTFNLYAYVLNNPLKFADPTGHSATIPGMMSNDPYFLRRTQNSDMVGIETPSAQVEEVDGGETEPGNFMEGKKSDLKDKRNILPTSKVLELIEENNQSGQGHELILCQAYQESHPAGRELGTFNADARVGSHRGLLQISPEAAMEAGFGNGQRTAAKNADYFKGIFDPATNLRVGTAYLKIRIDRAKGDVKKGLEGFGTGAGYADRILRCAGRVKARDIAGGLNIIYPSPR